MPNRTKRLKPREALEVSPFDVGVFTWKMKTRSIEENNWLQIDEGRDEDLLLKKQGPFGIHLKTSEPASLKLLKTIESWLTRRSVTLPVLDDSLHPIDKCGQLIQEDVCLMERKSDTWILTAASVCFPTHWSPISKLGLSLDEIHSPVPRYDTDLIPRPVRFLDRISDEMLVARTGWSLTASGELPLKLEHQVVQKDPSKLIVRVERQTLRKVPNSKAIVFTIRIHRWPLGLIKEDLALADDLQAALKALPDELRDYKTETAELSSVVQKYLSDKE